MIKSNKKIEELQKKIKRIKTELGGMENVVDAVVTHTYNFKGRKSSAIAQKIMGVLAPQNAVICDPFCGSGAFGIAAGLNNLKFIGCELDNYTFDVTKILFTKMDEKKFNEYYARVKEECRSKVFDLYETECCGVKNFISKLHFDPEGDKGFASPEYYNPTGHRDIVNNENVVLVTACPVCNKKRKVFTTKDEDKILSCEKLDVSDFPAHKLIENSRINITAEKKADYYNRNFTHRAQYALLLIQKSILKLPKSFERDVLEHCLVASLTLSRVSQYGSGSEYIYQVMRKQAQEKNVWEVFESKVEYFREFKRVYSGLQCDCVTDPESKLYLANKDYGEFLKDYDGKVDIIYTDPPYTDQVAYLERSQLFRDWLNKFYYKNRLLLTDDALSKEIVVTNAPSRTDKSGLLQYYRDVDKLFSSFYKALKPDGVVVMHIKLGAKKYISVLAEYIRYARKNGFEIIDRCCIDKKDPTLRKQAARKNTLANELIVFFAKLDKSEAYWYIGDEDIEFKITKLLYTKIKKSEKCGIQLSECVMEVKNFLFRNYKILEDEKLIARIVQTVRNNFLVLDNSLVCINPSKLYLDMEDEKSLFIKLYDIIPVIIRGFGNYGFDLEDLYSEIIKQLFDGNTKTLNQILESSDHELQIKALLERYCNVDDDDVYYLKVYKNQETTEDSIELSTLNGTEFEQLTARLLAKQGYYDIMVIGQSGDRGIDIIAKKLIDGKEEKFLIQCKRWLGNVGGAPIQRLHSMMVQLNVPNAVCITTSDFTPDAKREAKSTGVALVNGKELLDILAIYFPEKYYLQSLATE